MYERLLDKDKKPTIEFLKDYIGSQSYSNLLQFEEYMNNNYQLSKEMRFPFGNNYGWGYKYSHKSNHLCYAFFEAGAFTVMLQLGDNCVAKVEQMLPEFSAKTVNLWKNRYPCGKQGGWIHFRVLDANELNDIFELIKIKKKPILR